MTNTSADKLAKVFKNYFDTIVFDGPCSGEGMFRKDPDAIQYWHNEYPSELAQLQKDILSNGLKMLAPGGQLIYSTCTWSPEENEGVVAWILENYPDLELVEIPKWNGMRGGIDFPETARMYPHHFKGEGQFVAKFQDKRVAEQARIKEGKSNLNKEQKQLWEDFAKKHLKTDLDGLLQVFGDNLYLLPKGLPDLSKVKIARNGLHLRAGYFLAGLHHSGQRHQPDPVAVDRLRQLLPLSAHLVGFADYRRRPDVRRTGRRTDLGIGSVERYFRRGQSRLPASVLSEEQQERRTAQYPAHSGRRGNAAGAAVRRNAFGTVVLPDPLAAHRTALPDHVHADVLGGDRAALQDERHRASVPPGQKG